MIFEPPFTPPRCGSCFVVVTIPTALPQAVLRCTFGAEYNAVSNFPVITSVQFPNAPRAHGNLAWGNALRNSQEYFQALKGRREEQSQEKILPINNGAALRLEFRGAPRFLRRCRRLYYGAPLVLPNHKYLIPQTLPRRLSILS